MKNKFIQFVPVSLTLLAIGFDYFSNWCVSTIRVCYGTTISHITFTVTQPLYFLSLFLLPLVIILVFIPRNIFNSWLKLAAWMLPLAFIFIATQPVYATHILSTNRDDAARLAGQIFTVASLILIAWRALRSAHTK